MTTTQPPSVQAVCERAREAAPALALAPSATRTAAIHGFAERLERHAPELAALAAGQGDAVLAPLDARRLDRARAALLALADEPDRVGEVITAWALPDGQRVQRRRAPLGVVAYVCLGRPEAAVGAIGAGLRTGNAVVLYGTPASAATDVRLVALAADAAVAAGLPQDAIVGVGDPSPARLRALARANGAVDLIKQRGGRSLAAELAGVATVPIVYAVDGNCHLVVDAAADLDLARELLVDTKVPEQHMCCSIETLLVHADVAAAFLPAALATLAEHGVEARVDARAAVHALAAHRPLEPADWAREFLGPALAVGVVDDLGDAIAHVRRHGTGHSEAIVTRSPAAAERFAAEVDAACVYVNASTRLSSGPGLGLGPDIGMSTQRLPLRGPVSLDTLTTVKHVVSGAVHTSR